MSEQEIQPQFKELNAEGTTYQYRGGFVPILPLLFFLALSGCSWTDKGGTHYLIVGLGFGVITTTNRTGVEVIDSHLVGAQATTDGLAIGWVRQHHVAIDPEVASNVVISIKATPFGLNVKNYDFLSEPPTNYCEPKLERMPP